MIITIDNEYFIETDPYQYILKRKAMIKDRKTGEIKKGEYPEGYFGNIEGALKVYAKRKINDDKSIVSIQRYIDKIKEMLNFELTTIKVNIK